MTCHADLKNYGQLLVLRRDHKLAHFVRRELSLKPKRPKRQRNKDARDVQLPHHW